MAEDDDPYARLAGSLERIRRAAGTSDLARVLRAEDLSSETGIPAEVVQRLLTGGRAEETSVADRVRQRLDFLRTTRLRDDGKPYSQDQLADVAGVTRQTFGDWLKKGMPSLESADRLRRFFNLPPGFFFADDAEALNEALQPHLRNLESSSDPLASLRTPEILRLAARGMLSADGVQAMARWAESVTRPQTDQGSDGADEMRHSS
ncbi:helix-turn-helix transcriptional regulator (plasmid) [Streptomyces sp. R39]|uniref:Helix-turn-helix transcriptional regulator n=1 Tax=Streptomyces sp. R39 TaxID=3238631 RepID=A0AB39R8L2_9ACTN